VFFQHENRFRYKFFDIVQFSRSCQRLSRPADDLIILPQKCFFVKLFFQKLLNFLNLDVSKSLKSLWDFLTSIGSFQGLLAEALEVILLPQRLALKYNTTHRASCQHFSAAFFKFFLFSSKTIANGQVSTPPLRPRPQRLPFAKGRRALQFSGECYII
jgi:hypothetical protein